MTDFEVHAVIQGNSANEVASKLMTAAYVMEFEMPELEVEEIEDDPGPTLFWEDVEEKLIKVNNPEDNSPHDSFKFPHIQTLVADLQSRKKDKDG